MLCENTSWRSLLHMYNTKLPADTDVPLNLLITPFYVSSFFFFSYTMLWCFYEAPHAKYLCLVQNLSPANTERE